MPKPTEKLLPQQPAPSAPAAAEVTAAAQPDQTVGAQRRAEALGRIAPPEQQQDDTEGGPLHDGTRRAIPKEAARAATPPAANPLTAAPPAAAPVQDAGWDGEWPEQQVRLCEEGTSIW